MFLWRLKIVSVGDQDQTVSSLKYVITNSNSADDARSKVKQINVGSEDFIREILLIGKIPSISESGPFIRMIVVFVKASYRFPNLSNTSFMPTGYVENIDQKLATGLGIEEKLGPITPDFDSPVDIGSVAAIIATTTEELDQMAMIISSQIFNGQIPSENITITEMRKVAINIS
jgi:hypothetical protein